MLVKEPLAANISKIHINIAEWFITTVNSIKLPVSKLEYLQVTKNDKWK